MASIYLAILLVNVLVAYQMDDTYYSFVVCAVLMVILLFLINQRIKGDLIEGAGINIIMASGIFNVVLMTVDVDHAWGFLLAGF